MGLNGYREMEPNLLYGIVNMRLRNDYRDLDELCRSEGIEREVLAARLAAAGFSYQVEVRQFR